MRVPRRARGSSASGRNNPDIRLGVTWQATHMTRTREGVLTGSPSTPCETQGPPVSDLSTSYVTAENSFLVPTGTECRIGLLASSYMWPKECCLARSLAADNR